MREGNYRLPNVKKHRLYDPHVVIIGAGASKAACPIDKNGKAVPVLRNSSLSTRTEKYRKGK
jgi:hypothetical protein